MVPWIALAAIVGFALIGGCSEALPPGPESGRPAGAIEEGASREGMLDSVIDPFEEARTLMAGVPCEAAYDAATTTGNLKLLGLVAATFGDEQMGSRELDIHGDLALSTLARGGTNGIAVFNISDPLRPRQVGLAEEVGGLDVKFSPDGLTALVGDVYTINIVDVRDPTQPTLIGVWNLTQGPTQPGVTPEAHMLYTAEIAGQQWVFMAPRDYTGVWILKLNGPPEARTLEFVTQTLPVQGGPLGPHDMFVTQDSVDGNWYLYTADGFNGWSVFDIDDPTVPQRIGGIVRPQTGYVHTIQAVHIGDRRLVAVSQEMGMDFLEVYDATDLAAPILLATWQITPGSTTSQHNFNIAGGRIYLAHYNNGIFVFDLNTLGDTPLVSELQPVAHYGSSGSDTGLGYKEFYDVVVRSGIVYGASMDEPIQGINVIGDGCLAPGDVALTSIG